MNLHTTYMGLDLKNPLIPSASPLSENVDTIRHMQDAGAAAVVMFSIFEEQIQHDEKALAHLLTAGSESFPEAMSYFPDMGEYQMGPNQYIQLIGEAVEAVEIPIIGSLNGVSHEGWIDYAKQIEQAGAKGIELNTYYIPTDPTFSGEQVETMYIDVLKAVKQSVQIPVAIKLSPFFSAMANMATKLDAAGADALVLFNRFYQPDFDLDHLEVVPNLDLSTSAEMRLPLRWIAILHGKIKASMAATTGVHTGEDMAKYLLAGADAVMSTSALLQHGVEHISTLLNELTAWMESKEYESVEQMKGAMSQQSIANPAAFERANYIKALEEYKARYGA
jgi:dihydroorotate dehydrogenase (fumarate)